MRQNYIRTAYSKGLGRLSVVTRHGLRNAAGAPIGMAGLHVGLMLSNVLVVERIFSWPGLGSYLADGFAASDTPAILGTALAFGCIYLIANLCVDILQKGLDPRLKD
jgi:peptide/nickel transport system permease protein/dipeptide transport system permease protein